MTAEHMPATLPHAAGNPAVEPYFAAPASDTERKAFDRRLRKLAGMPPRHFNPMPMFGLRPHRCRECGLYLEPGENRIVHLGSGVLAKMGLCSLCLNNEMHQRWEDEEWQREMDSAGAVIDLMAALHTSLEGGKNNG